MIKKIDKHIEIVRYKYSPLSTSMGQKSSDDILAVLSKHYARVGVSIVNDISDLEAVVASSPDLVFLGMKFMPTDNSLGMRDPNKIWVAKYLDERDIAYTGSNYIAHEREISKPTAKKRVLAAGLKTSRFYVAKKGNLPDREEINLTFPLFIKPTGRGGGQGVDSKSVVHNFEQLTSKVQSITTDFSSDSLIEEYLPGREFSVAILKDKYSTKFFIMPLELIAPVDKRGVRILGWQIKHADTESSIEVTDNTIKTKVNALALNAFRALGARDYGRIDIRLDTAGVPHFLEANLTPGLKRSVGGYFPKACLLNKGLDYEAIILSIAELGLARSKAKPMDVMLPNKTLDIFLESIAPALESI